MDQNDHEPDPGMEPPAIGQTESSTAIRRKEHQETARRREARRPGRPRPTSAEGRRARAADRELQDRPGVPMEAEPRPAEGAHWTEPERQDVTIPLFKREGLDRLTPVVGTAQPPRGLSGMLRRVAYGIPEHRARHWGLLLAADRVDVLEDRLGRGFGAALRAVGMRQLARRAERNPLPMVAGAVLAGLAVTRAVRNGR